MRPSFFIIGAAKAATTTVWSLLNEHPDVFMPERKEPNYLLGGDLVMPARREVVIVPESNPSVTLDDLAQEDAVLVLCVQVD